MARFGDYLDDVYDWNVTAGHVADKPEDQLDRWYTDYEHRDLAVALIEEEVAELRDAVEEEDIVETLDALCDILFTLFGLASKSGLDTILEEGLKEVVNSNFTKLDGKKGDPNIKVGKSAKGYKPPQLDRIVQEAYKKGKI